MSHSQLYSHQRHKNSLSRIRAPWERGHHGSRDTAAVGTLWGQGHRGSARAAAEMGPLLPPGWSLAGGDIPDPQRLQETREHPAPGPESGQRGLAGAGREGQGTAVGALGALEQPARLPIRGRAWGQNMGWNSSHKNVGKGPLQAETPKETSQPQAGCSPPMGAPHWDGAASDLPLHFPASCPRKTPPAALGKAGGTALPPAKTVLEARRFGGTHPTSSGAARAGLTPTGARGNSRSPGSHHCKFIKAFICSWYDQEWDSDLLYNLIQ